MNCLLIGFLAFIPCPYLNMTLNYWNSDIAPHKKPAAAFSENAKAVLGLIFVAAFGGGAVLIIVGSGWWAILYIPLAVIGSMVASVIVGNILSCLGAFDCTIQSAFSLLFVCIAVGLVLLLSPSISLWALVYFPLSIVAAQVVSGLLVMLPKNWTGG